MTASTKYHGIFTLDPATTCRPSRAYAACERRLASVSSTRRAPSAAPFARAEAGIGIDALLEQLLALVGDTEDVQYYRTWTIRGPMELPLTFTRAPE